jgi:Peptidase family M1 domain
MRPTLPVAAAAAFLLIVPAISAQTPQQAPPAVASQAPGASRPALSTRVVAYQIDARLDPVKKTIDATETLVYRNLTGQPLETFPFHLYMNAFEPRSTYMTETRLYGTRGFGAQFKWKEKYAGGITVSSLEADGMGDLTGKMQFIQPDDHNPNDRTVFEVSLPKPVPAGASVTFRMRFHEQLPEVFERSGYKRDFYMVGQWFPKVGVWWHGAWNCHQFHATSEFFADFGTFDVRVTLPRNYIVGATGDEVSSTNNPGGTKTVRYEAEDVHDFAWTASPRFRLVEDEWKGGGRAVKIHLLVSPGHESTIPRYLHAVKGAMTLFDRWYGPYPYDAITVVDPPNGALNAGGMEYPTLITAGTTWWMPRGLRTPEITVVHEFGHQYWYGMVATNEFEEAWLDEGINSYAEQRAMTALYGPDHSAVDWLGMTANDPEMLRLEYAALPDADPLTHFAYQFMNMNSYGGVTYGKTATMLRTLEGIVGKPTVARALRVYFERYRFTHPTGKDFLDTINEVAGQDLGWYFEQAVSGTRVLDDEVLDIDSDRLDWYRIPLPAARPGQTLYRDTVLVRRNGDFILPVNVLIGFEDGKTVTEHWNGQERWIRYQFITPAKLSFAEVDPEHRVPLDINQFNNSRTRRAHPAAIAKLAGKWLFLWQFFAQLLSWLA